MIPTLVLAPRIPKMLLERYRQMMETITAVPCQSFLPAISPLGWSAWKERLAAERLQRRAANVLSLLERSNHHWEEIFWRLLAANFGVKVNSALFEQVAMSLPVNTLARHKNQLHELEALLLGQANLLSGKYHDAYAVSLQRDYRFLKKKYQLQPATKAPAFLRMRPASFPTVRLAQLAALVHTGNHLFSQAREARQLADLQAVFMVTASDYWHYRYRLDELTVHRPKHLGAAMADNLVINTVIPVLFAYGLHTKEVSYQEKAIQWLYQLPAEHNQLTKRWEGSGITNHSALDSQAFIELTNHYCLNRRCLDCAVGNRIFKNGV
jgi:hypothetical protein